MDQVRESHKHLAVSSAVLVVALWVGLLIFAGHRVVISAETATPTDTVPPTRPTLPQTLPPTREPSATPTATPRPVHLPLAMRQVRKLANGDFEAGTLYPWHHAGQLACTVVATPVHNGLYAALLGKPTYDNWGGCPVGESAIYQIIDVPPEESAELHIWYRIYSYDTVEFDYFAVDVSTYPFGPSEQLWLDGGYFWSPGVLWNSGWRQAIIALDNYRGETILVRLYTAMTNDDGYYNTWTIVDDIRLVTGYVSSHIE